jgi:tripartite-type tricarboxylate transporter receptor subunit TctC
MRKLPLAVAFAGVAFAALAVPSLAVAEGYPSRPITFIVPYGAGGPVDVLARALSEPMRAALGQPIIIENVVGANGTIGVGRAVHAAPDGYTVNIGNWPSNITNGAIYNLNYDVQKDLVPVVRLPQNPYIAVVRKDLPAKDLKEFIAWLKANPDKATEGTAGLGSGQHISGVYFQKITGVKFQFVPYKAGSSDIIRDITAGHIDFTFDQAITSLSHIKSGNVRALAVTSNQRLEAAPEIPTVDEAGAPGIYISTWYGLWVPKGTPQEAVDKLAEAARTAMADPALRARLTSLGQQIPPVEQQNAAALGAHTKAEIDKWHPIIKEAGIKAE